MFSCYVDALTPNEFTFKTLSDVKIEDYKKTIDALPEPNATSPTSATVPVKQDFSFGENDENSADSESSSGGSSSSGSEASSSDSSVDSGSEHHSED